MTILLSNDDGVQSEGLHSLREGLIDAGHRVISVAPAVPRSGSARGATFRPPVNLWKVGGDNENPIYACDGTPVDCVRVALLSKLGDDVAIVVSGINEGANLGDDSTYSSTLGAATEGALLGLPAISVSQQSMDGLFRLVDLTGYNWDMGVTSTIRLVEETLKTRLPERTVINVNYPGQPADPMQAKVVRLGRRAWKRSILEEEVTENGKGYFSFGTTLQGDAPYHPEPGTDFHALSQGHISLTALSVDWSNPGAVIDLEKWLDSIKESILPSSVLDLKDAN